MELSWRLGCNFTPSGASARSVPARVHSQVVSPEEAVRRVAASVGLEADEAVAGATDPGNREQLTALVQTSHTSSLWQKVGLVDVVSPRMLAAEKIQS